jgi:adenylate cyclase
VTGEPARFAPPAVLGEYSPQVMPGFQLVPVAGGEPIEVGPGPPRTVGRTPQCDVPVYDGTISRSHAELALLADGVRVRDLRSTNGTYVNGERVEDHVAAEGDTVAFGSVSFRLCRTAAAEPAAAPPDLATAAHEVTSTILRKVPAPAASAAGGAVDSQSGLALFSLVRGIAEERVARKLALLLELATELGRQPDVDRLLRRIVDLSFAALTADRACLLAVHGDALELLPRAARARRGPSDAAGRIPRAIAYQVLTERVAVLSDNVGQDERFTSDSARALSRQSALCVPLVSPAREVLGLLYLERADRLRPFSAEDLELMTAFGALAAVTLDHQRLAERERRDAEVLERLQRYLSPGLAAELALHEGRVALLHPARRPIALLQCQLHDFAAQADALPAEELAELLGAYLSRLSQAIFEYGGTLDNVCGHALLAIWGAPLARPDDPDRALRAALAARAATAELGRLWSRRGIARLELAAGLVHGEAFVGSISHGQRVEYVVAGSLLDEVGLLCAHAGSGGVLLGDGFYRALAKPPAARAERLPGADARRLEL